MEHDALVELASAYVDDEVSEAEAARVEAHLDRCPTCRRFVDTSLALRRRARVAAAGPGDERPGWIARLVPVPTNRRLRRRLAATAAGAALVAGAVGVAAVLVGGAAPPARHDVAATATPESTPAGAEAVRAGADSFDRTRVSVPAGGAVELQNRSANRHVLVGEAGTAPVTVPLGPGAHERLAFEQPGVYEVHCEIHPHMAVTVTVQA